MRKLYLAGAASLVLFGAGSTPAAVLLSNVFNYADGSLVTNSAGAWVTHSGTTGQLQVVSGRALLSQTNSEDVNTQLAGQPYGASTNVLLYASFTINFLTRPTGTNGAYFAHFKDSTATGFRGKIYATTNGVQTPNTFRVGLANADNAVPNVLITSNLSLNTDYVLVTRYAPSNATATLWLNPSSETDPSVSAADSATTLSVVAFALRESFASPHGMGTLYFDNLIVGTSFSDVASNSPALVAPTITTDPQSQMVFEGSNATFTVTATGNPAPTYQWQFNTTNLPGETNPTLLRTGVTTNQAGVYSVIASNSVGVTNSQPATLTVVPAGTPPLITLQPESQVVTQSATVTFSIAATGPGPLSFQWQFYGTNLSAASATNDTLTLFSVTTNQAGPYNAIVSNAGGSTSSDPATLTVNVTVPSTLPVLSVLTYNVSGNGATNWTTNAPQVQAIGRQVMYLQPDIITFNEIPNGYVGEMANFVLAYLPGYYLATNSVGDGFIRNAIASRFPILRSKSYLHLANLDPYGYTNSNFTRDLFQAQIDVPGFPQPLDVFVAHLKATSGTPYQDDADKRAAEACAITNFFWTNFFKTNLAGVAPTNGLHPFLLNGDLNEDIFRPETAKYVSGHPIQTLTNWMTGLRLTTPLNPITHTDLTESVRKTLNVRFDYILPCGLLYSNILSSQVFRTDVLTNPAPPPPLLRWDDTNASDHLPVFMIFANPYDKPFRLLSLARSNQATTLQWESVRGQPYRVEASSNLTSWSGLADNLMATGATLSFSTNVADSLKFFRVYRIP